MPSTRSGQLIFRLPAPGLYVLNTVIVPIHRPTYGSGVCRVFPPFCFYWRFLSKSPFQSTAATTPCQCAHVDVTVEYL